jgi:hypothetical protein
MLKIKDNVNLSELKKFGFNAHYGEHYVLFRNDLWVCISVNRELLIDIEDEVIEESEIKELSTLIYKLTKADLIEYVED